MFRMMKALFTLAVLAATLAPAAAIAADRPRDVACTINVSHTINNGVPQVYTRDFAIINSTPFHDDFGNVFRIREFNASVRLGADGKTIIDFDYYNDVTVFEGVAFNASLAMYDENGTQASGGQSFGSSRLAAQHNTDWTMSCSRIGK